MLSPLIFRNAQVRSTAGQLHHVVFVRSTVAVAAVTYTVRATQTFVTRKDSRIQNNSKMCNAFMPWTFSRAHRVEELYFHKSSSPVVTLSSCFSTSSAGQYRRSGCNTTRAARPEAAREKSERFLVHFQTVDNDETTFFDKHSADWWDVDGPFAALHDYTPYRVEFLIDNLQTLPHYQHVLRQRLHREALDTAYSVSDPPLLRGRDTSPSSTAQRMQHAPAQPQNTKQSVAGPAFVGGRTPIAVGKDSVRQQPRGRLDGFTVLDVGCGGGILSEALAREGSSIVVGVDAACEAINVAEHRRLRGPYAPLIRDRQRYVNASLESCVAHGDQLLNSFPPGLRNLQVAVDLDPFFREFSFDVVVFSEMLEHVSGGLHGVETLLAMAAEKCLKPGGLLMVTTLNRTPENYLMSIVAAETVFSIVPQGTHAWDKFVRPEEISRIGERHGLRLVEQRGFTYVPFMRVFVNEPFCRFLYMMAFEKL